MHLRFFDADCCLARLAAGVPGGIVSIFRSVVAENGMMGIMKGVTPALVSNVPFIGVNLGIFTSLKTQYNDYIGKEPPCTLEFDTRPNRTWLPVTSFHTPGASYQTTNISHVRCEHHVNHCCGACGISALRVEDQHAGWPRGHLEESATHKERRTNRTEPHRSYNSVRLPVDSVNP
eukprot:638652-Amphidinium_carterae.1